MSNPNGIPPLAPDDKPFDDEPDPSLAASRWWVVVAIIVTIALIAALASPIFSLW